MHLIGGHTNYGQDIGILMLDTQFPRVPGDIGNARSYHFPVRYKVVKDAIPEKIMGDEPDKGLLAPFIEAAQELEKEGVKAITTSCGFLAPFQRDLANAVNIPVFTSALMLAPLIRTMMNENQVLGVFTERARYMNEAHFQKVGWSTRDIPTAITGMPEDSPFPALFIGNQREGDRAVLKECMEELTRRHMAAHPNTGAILFECTNFGPFTKDVQAIAKVPVYGINQLLEFVASAVRPKAFPEEI